MTGMDAEKSRNRSERNQGRDVEAGAHGNHAENREQNLDKTIADSFPASDPPSTDPNPDGDE